MMLSTAILLVKSKGKCHRSPVMECDGCVANVGEDSPCYHENSYKLALQYCKINLTPEELLELLL